MHGGQCRAGWGPGTEARKRIEAGLVAQDTRAPAGRKTGRQINRHHSVLLHSAWVVTSASRHCLLLCQQRSVETAARQRAQDHVVELLLLLLCQCRLGLLGTRVLHGQPAAAAAPHPHMPDTASWTHQQGQRTPSHPGPSPTFSVACTSMRVERGRGQSRWWWCSSSSSTPAMH
jgi:hypothetical protein